MKLKYYAIVPNVEEAIKYYATLFQGTILKDGRFGHHGYIKLFDQISLHLASGGNFAPKPGYLIIRFDDHEALLYMNAIRRLRQSTQIKINFNLLKAKWGTTFFEFRDQYGYTWDLEIKTSVLEAAVTQK